MLEAESERWLPAVSWVAQRERRLRLKQEAVV